MRPWSRLILASALVLAVAQACGSSSNPTSAQSAADGGEGPGPLAPGGDGGCINLECHRATCSAGATTTISGSIYDPAGKHPLYNAFVYIPNSPVKPLVDGASCERCGTLATGSPLSSVLTGPDGKFVLTDVPVTDHVPIVIQLGKWRRQITFPGRPAACADNPLTDTNLTRLPRSKREGDIPKTAMVTGNADPFECLLRKIGIDDAEFTRPSEPGRIHVYRQNGSNLPPPVTREGYELWSSDATLKKYDIVILACEGQEHPKDADATANMVKYAAAGGRIFSTHYGYVWLHGPRVGGGAEPFAGLGGWNVDQPYDDTVTMTGVVDDGFPKGNDFKQWLSLVGASTTPGQLPIIQWRHDLDGVDNPPAQRWMYASTPESTPKASVQHLTFNTPLGVPLENQCGKVVYSDFHVIAAPNAQERPDFPLECDADMTMNAQEKALEFMLFDLSSCIQKENAPPEPPLR